VAAALLAVAFSGCIVLPLPMHQPQRTSAGSRANVGAASAPQIVAGQTTRLELLLAFGEPDGRGAQDRWFTYRTRTDRGGWHWALVCASISPGLIGIPVGDWERVERLTVRFDERGVVSDVSFEGRNCTGCRGVLSATEGGAATRP
jgi:hypothetical protein